MPLGSETPGTIAQSDHGAQARIAIQIGESSRYRGAQRARSIDFLGVGPSRRRESMLSLSVAK
jgi:hypothetical protein